MSKRSKEGRTEVHTKRVRAEEELTVVAPPPEFKEREHAAAAAEVDPVPTSEADPVPAEEPKTREEIIVLARCRSPAQQELIAAKRAARQQPRQPPVSGSKLLPTPLLRQLTVTRTGPSASTDLVAPVAPSESPKKESVLVYVDAGRRAQQDEERAKKDSQLHEQQKQEGRELLLLEAQEKRRRQLEDQRYKAKQKSKELQQIYSAFLGDGNAKKRTQKPSEKFRNVFKFAWDSTEDTSDQVNRLYKEKANVQLAFGKGFVGGVDWIEQNKKNRYIDELTKLRFGNREATEEELEDYKKLRADMDKGTKRQSDQLQKGAKHWKTKSLEEMTERDWRIFREDHNIYLEGGKSIYPWRAWRESDLEKSFMDYIAHLRYKELTPIQMQSIPIGFSGRDCIGIAETGSGKTAAFTIPLLSYITHAPTAWRENTFKEGPLAMIIAPTRELAQQLYDYAYEFGKAVGVRVMGATGGVSTEGQGMEISGGCDVMVGTVGRINALIEDRYLVLNQCCYVVMDEADTMIDMQLEEDVQKLVGSIHIDFKSENEAENEIQSQKFRSYDAMYRTTVMFSATMEPAIEKLARTYLRCPVKVTIGGKDQYMNMRITQEVRMIDESRKKTELILSKYDGLKFIFVNTRAAADDLTNCLKGKYIRAMTLHAGRSSRERETSLSQIKNGDFQILIATDVAARGLDIEGVKVVINYDCPSNIQRYTHRIGRTARAGEEGLAITFLTKEDEDMYYDIRKHMMATKQLIPKELSDHPRAMAPAATLGTITA